MHAAQIKCHTLLKVFKSVGIIKRLIICRRQSLSPRRISCAGVAHTIFHFGMFSEKSVIFFAHINFIKLSCAACVVYMSMTYQDNQRFSCKFFNVAFKVANTYSRINQSRFIFAFNQINQIANAITNMLHLLRDKANSDIYCWLKVCTLHYCSRYLSKRGLLLLCR